MKHRCRPTSAALRRQWAMEPGTGYHSSKQAIARTQSTRSFSSTLRPRSDRPGDGRRRDRYTPPGSPPLVSPGSAPGDFITSSTLLARPRSRRAALDGRRQLRLRPGDDLPARRPVDAFVAEQMRAVDLLLVLAVPTSEPWTTDDVCLIIPNDREMWSSWPCAHTRNRRSAPHLSPTRKRWMAWHSSSQRCRTPLRRRCRLLLDRGLPPDRKDGLLLARSPRPRGCRAAVCVAALLYPGLTG